MGKKIFIDGEAGTTGLGIAQRLSQRSDIEIVQIAPQLRKNVDAKMALMAGVDLIILCLPDEAARQTVAIIDQMREQPKILDASSAHRTAPDWTYGFAELTPDQGSAIAKAARVSNPGCFATGAIALLRPLVDAGVICGEDSIVINAVSGFTGGGRAMITEYESGTAPDFELYGLGFNHKHLPEIKVHAHLKREPIFVPSVGNFPQGMLVSMPLHLDALKSHPTADMIYEIWVDRYGNRPYVRVIDNRLAQRLNASALKNEDYMELHLFRHSDSNQVLMVARFDNLGKGASGAAVQNLDKMLGLNGG